MNFCFKRIGILLVTVLSLLAELSALEVTASLDSAQIPLGGYTYLNIVVENETRADITEPKVEGLTIRNSGSSTNTSIINGKISKSVTMRLTILGEKEGVFEIPSITVRSGKEEVETEAFQVTVTKNPTNNGSQQSSRSSTLTAEQIAEIAFIELKAGKTKIFTGEKIPLIVRLNLNTSYRFNQINSLPDISNDLILMDPLGEPTSQTVVSKGKHRYEVYTWKTSITAVKPGEVNLKTSLELGVLVRARRQSNSRSIFDSDFFSPSYQNVPLLANSNDLQIEIAQFPENEPEEFSGAIGTFDFKVEASPTELSAGDPITLNIEISGNGNFDRVYHDGLKDHSEFKTYTPELEFLANEENPLIGKKVFKQAVIPTNASIKEIPSLKFVYLDAKNGEFKTLQSTPIPLDIKDQNGVTVRNSDGTVQTVVKLPTIESDGIVSFSQTLTNPQSTLLPYFRNPKFLVYLAASPAALILLSIIMSLFLEGSRDLNAKKAKERSAALKVIAKELDNSIKEQDAPKFIHTAAEYSKTLLSYKLDVEAKAITVGDAKSHLADQYPKTVEIIGLSETIQYSGIQTNGIDLKQKRKELDVEWNNLEKTKN